MALLADGHDHRTPASADPRLDRQVISADRKRVPANL